MQMIKNKVILTKEELPKNIIDLRKSIRALVLVKLKHLYNTKYEQVIDKEYFKKAYASIADENNEIKNEIMDKNNKFEAMIQATGHIDKDSSKNGKNFLNLAKDVFNDAKHEITKQFDCRLSFDDVKEHGKIGYDFYTTSEVAKAIWNHAHKTVIKESGLSSIQPSPILDRMFNELFNAAKTDGPIQSKVNIVCNLIKKETGVDISVNVTDYNHYVIFNIPELGMEFIKSFIDGKFSYQTHIINNPLNMDISRDIFYDAEDVYQIKELFSQSIEFYYERMGKFAEIIFNTINSFDVHTKRILTDTLLGNMIECALKDGLTIWDDFKITDKDLYEGDKDSLRNFIKFIRFSINKRKAPEKEQKRVLGIWQSLLDGINTKTLGKCARELQALYNGEYDETIKRIDAQWISENVDRKWNGSQGRYFSEAFKVKKLKKLPRDIITYITIEAENITSANDKMMIASYCISKLEICEWYIALLDAESKKFIVPHDRPYLEWMRTALLKCYKDIMNTKVINPNKRPLLDIQYPTGYEG